MDVLLQLFHKMEIDYLVHLEPNLRFIEKENTGKIIKLLKDNQCPNALLRGIIMKNPSFLLRNSSEIEDLIQILKEYGVEDFDLAFHLYPPLLNKGAYEIDNFYIKKHREGYSNDDINTILEVEPYLIDE